MEEKKRKRKIEAKLFPFAARKPLWEMAKKYGRRKYVLVAVWDYMLWRSGKGNVFELAEELVIADTGMDKDALRWARRTLVAEGWLRKENPRTPKGTMEVTRWVVSVPQQVQQAAVDSPPPLEPATAEAAAASTGDCSTGDTVEVHSLDAVASTVSSLPSGGTTPVKPNQAINQATNEANASSEIPDEDQTPFVSEYAQPNQNQEDPASDEGWIEELGMFFPRCPATQENLAMLKEVYAKLEGETVLLYGRKVALDIQRVISFNWEHHEGKLRIRSLRQAWNAIVHGDPENGVVAQAIAHNEETCRQCRKRLEADAKKEAIAQKADPMWKTDPVTEARSLVRKPKTASERRSLLDLRNKPKVRWGYIAKFLAQDNCPKCRGQSTSCACVMQEELLCGEFTSRSLDIEEGAVA
ncbi:MAG: hypothetical protein WCE53_04690 [Candidatus Acidiferrum sp.]